MLQHDRPCSSTRKAIALPQKRKSDRPYSGTRKAIVLPRIAIAQNVIQKKRSPLHQVETIESDRIPAKLK